MATSHPVFTYLTDDNYIAKIFSDQLALLLRGMSPELKADTLAVFEAVLQNLKAYGQVHCSGCGAEGQECDGF